jgi:hypothetical protein
LEDGTRVPLDGVGVVALEGSGLSIVETHVENGRRTDGGAGGTNSELCRLQMYRKILGHQGNVQTGAVCDLCAREDLDFQICSLYHKSPYAIVSLLHG